MYERRKKKLASMSFPAFYHYAKSLDTLVSEGIHHRPTDSVLNDSFYGSYFS